MKPPLQKLLVEIFHIGLKNIHKNKFHNETNDIYCINRLAILKINGLAAKSPNYSCCRQSYPSQSFCR